MVLKVSPVPGTRVEAVGSVWVAFSPASGETMFLNDESVAIVEIVVQGPVEAEAICATLANDSGACAADIATKLDECWPQLITAGLVRSLRSHR